MTYDANESVGPKEFVKVPQYHQHSPLLAAEFYRLINRLTLFLVNQSVEWTDMHSSFLNILQVVLGKADCFFNNVLPHVSDEGQRGHELGAIMPFVKELGAYALDMRTGRPLAETPFTFDGMTPVMIGVDEKTVEYYRTMIATNLSLVTIGSEASSVGDLIEKIVKAVPRERWSLRPTT
jgi:hypothetical protein